MFRKTLCTLFAALALQVAPATVHAQTAAPPIPRADEIEQDRQRKRFTDDGRFEEALPFATKLWEIRKERLGEAHTFTLDAAHFVATLHRWVGNFDEASKVYERIVDLLPPTQPGQEPPIHRYRALRGLIDTNRDRGDLEKAILIAEKAEKELSVHNAESNALVLAIGDRGRMERARGNWDTAESLLLRALAMLKNVGVPATVQYGTTTGKTDRDVAVLDHVSQTREGETGLLLELAQTAFEARRFDRAEEYTTRAEAAEFDVSKSAPSLTRANIFHLRSRIRTEQDKGDEALVELGRALNMREGILGPDHVGLCTLLHSEALLRTARGEGEAAEKAAKRALLIAEKAWGPDHRRVADLLLDEVEALIVKGRALDAVPLLDRAAQIAERHDQMALAVGSEAQKRALWIGSRKVTDLVVGFGMRAVPGDPKATHVALRSVLRNKGRLVDAAASELSALRKRLDPQVIELFDAIERVTAAIAAGAARGEDVAQNQESRDRVKRLTDERSRLERAVAERSLEYRAAAGLVTVEDVQARLPKNGRLVELFVYAPLLVPTAANGSPAATSVRWGDERYAAFVVSADAVHAVDLGLKTDIDKSVYALREELSNPDLSRDPSTLSKSVYTKVLRPLLPHLQGAEHLLWSPDGALGLLPPAALMDEKGHYLVERFLITHIASGRDLLRFSEHRRAEQGPLLLGAPAFGDLPNAPRSAATHRSGDIVSLGRVGFLPLPSTAVEVESIQEALGRGVVLVGEKAAESVVKRANSPSILHVATHGFFLPGPAVSPRAEGVDVTAAEIAAARADQGPLVRSGIALAGANLRASGNDDGILSALEASTLDLAGTELVVLSACETGLGQAVAGDGVYGLRRAFAIAGAQTLVMSLWRVDSGYTRALMTSYYGALGEGMGKSEALRKTQLAMLANPKTAHPNVWAAFFAEGSWAPLQAGAIPPKTSPGARGCSCEVAQDRGAGVPLQVALIAVAVAALRARRRGIVYTLVVRLCERIVYTAPVGWHEGDSSPPAGETFHWGEGVRMLIKPAKWVILFALFVAACGAAQEPAKGPAEGGTAIAEGEVCPSIAAAAPDQRPSCPEGCEWKGTECRASRPIVIYDRPVATGTSTSTAPTLPAPTSTAPSTP